MPLRSPADPKVELRNKRQQRNRRCCYGAPLRPGQVRDQSGHNARQIPPMNTVIVEQKSQPACPQKLFANRHPASAGWQARHWA